MAILPIHNFFVLNNEIKPVSDFIPSENEGGIYEVLRVVDGTPLFLNDHLIRFNVSAQLAGKKIKFTEKEIKKFLTNLINSNQVYNGNILFSCKNNLKAFFISHKYPLPQYYETGIKCGILQAKRENPNAKVFQTSVRQQADLLIDQNSLYEVLLVDQLDRITEGSRSNVFFIRKNKIITPPGNEVLLGITRSKAILIANELGFRVEESDVYLHKLGTFQSSFLTGTSPKILPINKINDVEFDPQNDVVKQIILSYEKLIHEYINNSVM